MEAPGEKTFVQSKLTCQGREKGQCIASCKYTGILMEKTFFWRGKQVYGDYHTLAPGPEDITGPH
jgi:hypothetical protein